MENFSDLLSDFKVSQISKGQLISILGGAGPNLHCRCIGAVGCWFYPGTSGGAGDGINVSADIERNCDNHPDTGTPAGECAYSDSWCLIA